MGESFHRFGERLLRCRKVDGDRLLGLGLFLFELLVQGVGQFYQTTIVDA